MSKLEWGPTSPEAIIKRLRELSDAVTKNKRDEFTMRVPAEPSRDADLVLSSAADLIERLISEQPKPAPLVDTFDFGGVMFRRDAVVAVGKASGESGYFDVFLVGASNESSFMFDGGEYARAAFSAAWKGEA